MSVGRQADASIAMTAAAAHDGESGAAADARRGGPPAAEPRTVRRLWQQLGRRLSRAPGAGGHPQAGVADPEKAAAPPADASRAEPLPPPPAERRLHFANTRLRVRAEDLPEHYEPGEVYRGIDSYVSARRMQRRKERRQGRRTPHSAQRPAGEESDGGADSDASSLSSSSSASSNALQSGLARIRALFGDDSGSSSSDDSDTDDDGATSVVSGTSRHSRSGDDRISVFSARSRRARILRDDGADASSPHPSVAFPPWTPRIGTLTGARRRRQTKRRRTRREITASAQLKASRMARRNARHLREIAGGVTEYTLYAPMGSEEQPVLASQSWKCVRRRMDAYLQHHAQADAEAGDVGIAGSRMPFETPRGALVRQPSLGCLAEDEIDLALPPPALSIDGEEDVAHAACDAVRGDQTRSASALPSPRADFLFPNAADLHSAGRPQPRSPAVPPTADPPLLPSSTCANVDSSPSPDMGPARDPVDDAFEDEQMTGRHMSDIPVTPFFRAKGRGDPIASPMPFASVDARKTQRDTRAAPLRAPRWAPGADASFSSESLRAAPTGDLGAQKADAWGPTRGGTPSIEHTQVLRENPWWLDVRCPTYKDMQHLSQLFPLHPLTVEDILKQEQREKVESFGELGYYFVVIRALDEHYFRFTSTTTGGDAEAMSEKDAARAEEVATPSTTNVQLETARDETSKEGLEGLGAGTVSLYLVVFAHGVISFHFEDVDKHTRRVRERLEHGMVPMNHNSDWIVYGLYDSVIDSFVSYVSFLSREATLLEDIGQELSLSSLFGASSVLGHVAGARRSLRSILRGNRARPSQKRFDALMQNAGFQNVDAMRVVRTLRPRKRFKSLFTTDDAFKRALFFVRLTRARDLVTGFSRLLQAKPDVLRGLHKRLWDNHGGQNIGGTLILMYLDDVADHVSELANQLQECDSGLTHTNSTSMSSYNRANEAFRVNLGTKTARLTTVIIMTLACSLVTSLFSMNVRVPFDNQEDDMKPHAPMHPSLHAFGVIIVVLCF
ncbi:hypothetical protein MSPP1_001305 [Malassezia sp. CBS 17886]|nr:hypothetical protein MSPP1_001305 [Malassezia sp. CBS 17886]